VSSIPKHRRTLGDNIRVHRKRVKLTQEAFAEKAGLSVVFISLLENGHRTVSVDSLLRIAKALDVRLRDLVSEL
jgi:transcriptional regulator with XRE-family HTH domain